MDRAVLRRFLHRAGLTFVFLVFGVWEIINPGMWTGFVPPFLTDAFNALVLVRIHGVILIIVGIWVMSRYRLRIAAIIASLIMAQIVISLSTFGFSAILARDIAILIFILSLIFESKK